MESELVTLGAQAERETAPVASQAMSVAEAIKDQISYDTAARYLQTIKAARKKIGEILDPFVKSTYDTWKNAVRERDKYDDPLNTAESIVKPAMVKWYTQEQDRIAAERAHLEKEARKREEERMLAEAEIAAQNGDQATADAILDEPVRYAPPILPATPKTGGISMREEWKCEVSSLMDLVKAVAAGKVPLQALKADTVFLGQQARSLKAELKYPGVRVWAQKNVASRAF